MLLMKINQITKQAFKLKSQVIKGVNWFQLDELAKHENECLTSKLLEAIS